MSCKVSFITIACLRVATSLLVHSLACLLISCQCANSEFCITIIAYCNCSCASKMHVGFRDMSLSSSLSCRGGIPLMLLLPPSPAAAASLSTIYFLYTDATVSHGLMLQDVCSNSAFCARIVGILDQFPDHSWTYAPHAFSHVHHIEECAEA